VFFFRRKGQEERYLYRTVDEHGRVLDVLFRDHRDTEAAGGVPICALPLGADQPVNAVMVQRAGAGVLCATGETALGQLRLPVADPATLNPLDLRAQIRRVVDDPQYTIRARAIRSEIAALPGPDAVVALLHRRGIMPAAARAGVG
jgi:UDP:flavonoid glycosyltransferase YjiC (YdhE family)